MNAATIIGQVIVRIDQKDGESIDDDGDTTDIHFYTIVTAAGCADVELRVEHNGYYEGWLNAPVEVKEIPASAIPPEPD